VVGTASCGSLAQSHNQITDNEHVEVTPKRYVRHVTRSFLFRCAAVAAVSIAITSCGSNSSSTSDTSPVTSPVDLSQVCPSTVVIQTDWWPQAEHGFVYQLLGDDYEVDAANLSVSGSLVHAGERTGVRVQINAGGPAIGFDPVISRLYSQPEILLAFMGTDIAISKSEELPTISVIAPFNVNPQIIMWDPSTYPDVTTISDLKESNVKVLYFRNVAYMKYLVGAGILSESQVDDSYDGFPEQFITANGTVAQQGFGTNEPYFYENKLSQWLKPVRYQYIHETGWSPYAQSLATTPEKKIANDECLRALVPVIQQAQVDYVSDPFTANEIIIATVTSFNAGSTYDIEQATASAEKQLADGLVSNSPDGSLGSFDLKRVEEFIAIATPIYEDRGDKVKKNLTAADLVTNEYIDPNISIPNNVSK